MRTTLVCLSKLKHIPIFSIYFLVCDSFISKLHNSLQTQFGPVKKLLLLQKSLYPIEGRLSKSIGLGPIKRKIRVCYFILFHHS